jgi:hypothetical protein
MTMVVRMMIGSAIAAAAVLTGTTAAASPPQAQAHAHHQPDLSGLRAATNKFHSIAVAEQHGYGLLTDVNGIACIAMPSMPGMPAAAMGVHWANSKRVGNPSIVPKHPEAFVYAPGRNGTLRLAAVEYVVVKSAWDATHNHRPKLFRHTFNFTPAPNRFGLPAFYSLHVWAWKNNPAGTFKMFNPNVTCPS